MSNNSLEQNIERMEKELSEMKARLKAGEKWEPKGGGYMLTIRGHIRSDFGQTPDGHNDFGMCFQTEEQAEIASKLMRERNRIIQYVLEHEPDWKFEFVAGVDNYYIKFNHGSAEWGYGFTIRQESQNIYMPSWVADTLVDDLNSGRVEL